jgi:dTDP-4-amino-4,6-dideoxygalactose transaminase
MRLVSYTLRNDNDKIKTNNPQPNKFKNRMENQQITVTSPLLPDLQDFIPYLEDIWKRKWLTNNGHYHQELEKALSEYLKVPHISLFTNGTLPLITALQALRITGEVITAPYSFVATTHSLWWNGIKPVFVDIDGETCNINPEKIEAAITPKTAAIMPVHCYGQPCDVLKIKEIADKYGLKVIYDAAHAFGVESGGKSILEYGDMSTLSFHVTKVYNTVEGGALVCRDAETKRRIDYLKNFGFAGETTVVAPGINGKLDEIRAAYGLLALKKVDEAIASRKRAADLYREGLKNVEGIKYLNNMENVRHNYSYFPVFVNEKEYGMSRDALYFKMQKKNIFGRRYFYPLISAFSTYRGLDSASLENLPVATKVAESVICLPMYAWLEKNNVERIVNIIVTKGNLE